MMSPIFFMIPSFAGPPFQDGPHILPVTYVPLGSNAEGLFYPLGRVFPFCLAQFVRDEGLKEADVLFVQGEDVGTHYPQVGALRGRGNGPGADVGPVSGFQRAEAFPVGRGVQAIPVLFGQVFRGFGPEVEEGAPGDGPFQSLLQGFVGGAFCVGQAFVEGTVLGDVPGPEEGVGVALARVEPEGVEGDHELGPVAQEGEQVAEELGREGDGLVAVEAWESVHRVHLLIRATLRRAGGWIRSARPTGC